MSENETLVERLLEFADAEDNGGCVELQMRGSPCREAATALTLAQARIRELEGALEAEKDKARRAAYSDLQNQRERDAWRRQALKEASE